MEQLPHRIESDLENIETINNLDTARMALRWALERLHALEAAKEDLAQRLQRQTEARDKLEAEQKSLKRELSLRSEDAAHREQYYSRMKEFVSVRLSGKPDEAALAIHELELTQQQEALQQERIKLEKEYSVKRGILRSELDQLKLSLEKELQEQAQMAAQAESARRANLKQFYAEQLAELNEQLKGVPTEIERQLAIRLEHAQKQLDAQHRSQVAAWDEEKTALIKESFEWQRQAQEQRLRLHEMERILDVAKEQAMQSARAAEVRILHLEEEQQRFKHENANLTAEVVLWKQRFNQTHASSSAWEAKLVQDEGALIKREQQLALEYERKQGDLEKVKETLRREVVEIVRQYQAKLRGEDPQQRPRSPDGA